MIGENNEILKNGEINCRIGHTVKLFKIQAQERSGNFRETKTEGIEWPRDALWTIMKTVENQKLQIEEAKLANGEAPNDVTAWSSEIEEQQAAVDEEIAQLTKQLNDLIPDSTLEAKQCEKELVKKARGKELDLEKSQLEFKLDYERKIESRSSSSAKIARLPKLVITKFGVTLTDWPRFWNQFEAEIDRSDVPSVTKFSYLKELLEPNVRTLIDGLPFSTEGYERAKMILKSDCGKKSEIVNAYV